MVEGAVIFCCQRGRFYGKILNVREHFSIASDMGADRNSDRNSEEKEFYRFRKSADILPVIILADFYQTNGSEV
jgi:hypothetical protein